MHIGAIDLDLSYEIDYTIARYLRQTEGHGFWDANNVKITRCNR